MKLEYKESLLSYWMILILMLPITILFFVVFNSGDAIFQTVGRTKLVSLLCMLASASTALYSLFVISINFGNVRDIELDDEKIVFYRHPYSRKKATVYLKRNSRTPTQYLVLLRKIWL